MPKKKKLPDRQWMVPFEWKNRGYAFVTATTAEEAASKAEAGDYDSVEASETPDWEVTGEPELNE